MSQFTIYGLLCVAFGLAAPYARAEEGQKYARPHLLTEPAELEERLLADGSRFVLLDARSRSAHDAEHIPGAQWIDIGEWKKEFGEGTDTEAWSARLSELGVTDEARVVVYDEGSLKDAARAWWILRFWGVENAALLNGGWHAWSRHSPSEGLADSAATVDQSTPTPFEAKPHPERLQSAEQMRAMVASGDAIACLVDARSPDEYFGAEAGGDARKGAIPGSTHLEWSNLLDPETSRMKRPEELLEIFHRSGIELDSPVVTYCQSGGRASVMAFGLELMGADRVSNYYQSWSDWGGDPTTPIIVPERPEQPETRENSAQQ